MKSDCDSEVAVIIIHDCGKEKMVLRIEIIVMMMMMIW